MAKKSNISCVCVCESTNCTPMCMMSVKVVKIIDNFYTLGTLPIMFCCVTLFIDKTSSLS